jgi:hypothetical protein
MSAIARQSSQRGALERAKTPRAVAIRWEIGPRALLASRGAAMFNGEAWRVRACAVVIEIGPDGAGAALELLLADGGRKRMPLAARAGVSHASERGLESFAADGIVEATLREGGEEIELLYARTPVLERVLGLPGGVYDAPMVGVCEARTK